MASNVNISPVPTLEVGAVPFQRRLKEDVNGITVADLPESYRTNSEGEEAIIQHVDSFNNQFGQLYPQRPALFLFPKNESNQQVHSVVTHFRNLFPLL